MQTHGIALHPYTVEDLEKYMPKVREKLKMLRVLAQRELDQEKDYTEQDRFALNIVEMSLEDKIFCKLGFKAVVNGQLGWTDKGIQIGVVMQQVRYVDDLRNNRQVVGSKRQQAKLRKQKKRKRKSK